jgi:hypothetical protein
MSEGFRIAKPCVGQRSFECEKDGGIGTEAGRGNRTLVFSLEGYCSTIELHPQRAATAVISCRIEPIEAWSTDSGDTCQWGVQDSNLRRKNPSDLQSDPFDRSGNSPCTEPKTASVSTDALLVCLPSGCLRWANPRDSFVCLRSPLAVGLMDWLRRTFGRHWRLAGHSELAVGVEPATC